MAVCAGTDKRLSVKVKRWEMALQGPTANRLPNQCIGLADVEKRYRQAPSRSDRLSSPDPGDPSAAAPKSFSCIRPLAR